MKFGFYPRLAANGIKKNGKLYFPYLLTCISMVMMYYIISYLSVSEHIINMRGGRTLTSILSLGKIVILVFSLIFLFYTNSFLLRKRKKEFGLYNILGMGKTNIVRIVTWETVFTFVISLVSGLLLGIALSKLFEICLVRLVRGKITFDLNIATDALLPTTVFFLAIFLVIYVNSVIQIGATKPIDLLHSENLGEKPPKANFVFGFLGIIILAAAYAVAVTIKDPVSAVLSFFFAVIAVIVATYLIFIAGSVMICRLLQKNKKYYYKPNHFVSVSSMAYRMKRNGAGLASICILATMVLVMISSTSSLYFGEENSLDARYPGDFVMDTVVYSSDNMSDEMKNFISEKIKAICEKNNVRTKNNVEYRYLSSPTIICDGVTYLENTGNFNLDTYDSTYSMYIIPLSDYNAVMGTSETLESDEVLIGTFRGSGYKFPTFRFTESGNEYRVKKIIQKLPKNGDVVSSVLPSAFVIVPKLDEFAAVFDARDENEYFGGRHLLYYFDIDGVDNTDDLLAQEEIVWENIYEIFYDSRDRIGYSVELKERNRADFYGSYGGMFFLGIILSIVFIFAAVLIIYYKQISEGYEDKARFEIMQKVGMTKKEIKKSINSQLLTVFFMPLLFAGLHLAFAFPMIEKILSLFNLTNQVFFVATTLISFAAFALFYTIVYKITSNIYYKIVSGTKE